MRSWFAGAARRQVTFFIRLKKGNQRNAALPCRPFGVPSFWQENWAAAQLALDSLHKPQAAAELKQCSPSSQFTYQNEAVQKGQKIKVKILAQARA